MQQSKTHEDRVAVFIVSSGRNLSHYSGPELVSYRPVSDHSLRHRSHKNFHQWKEILQYFAFLIYHFVEIWRSINLTSFKWTQNDPLRFLWDAQFITMINWFTWSTWTAIGTPWVQIQSWKPLMELWSPSFLKEHPHCLRWYWTLLQFLAPLLRSPLESEEKKCLDSFIFFWWWTKRIVAQNNLIIWIIGFISWNTETPDWG